MTPLSSEHQTFLELCKHDKIVPQEQIINALRQASATGELDLSKRNHPTWLWKMLGKILTTSSRIHTLLFSDCYIPPECLSALCTSLCQNAVVGSLDLRGNNLQTTSVANLGKVLRHNTSLKILTLEWNSMGAYLDSFSMFCDGLAVNQTLESLCLKNNQLSPECAPLLARVIILNKTLQKIDLRWNNLGWKGGQHLQEAMKHNHVLKTIRLRGNCMPEDLVKAIEMLAQQNKHQGKITKELELKTDVLFHHLKKADIEHENIIKKTQEIIENGRKESSEMLKETQERLKEVVIESDSRISQLENILTERASMVKTLQNQVQILNEELKTNLDKIQDMTDQETLYKELFAKHKQSEEDLRKQRADKEDGIAMIRVQAEIDRAAEQRQMASLQSRIDSQLKDIQNLENEIKKHGDKLRLARSEHEESLLAEHGLYQAQLLKVEKDYEAKLSKLQTEMTYIRSSLQEELKEVERCRDDLQKKNSELVSQLAMEQVKADEKVALALLQARAREEARVSQLEDKLTLSREEKMALEKQVALVHSTTTQLQQHNAALVAEMGEPQRKLTKMHEDVANERLTNQRLRQELAEEAAKTQAKQRELEILQSKLLESQAKVMEMTQTNRENFRERQTLEEKMQSVISDKEKELKSIRLEEAERASALYAAFSKYLNSLGPSSTRTVLP